MAAVWTDLLDPSAEELREKAPRQLEESAIDRLLAPPEHEDEPRPTLQSHGSYVFGIFLIAVAVTAEDRIYYEEVDIVLTRDRLVTVSKTPPGEKPFDPRPAKEACLPDDSAGMMFYRLVDTIAEHYLDLIDDIDGEIDELEDIVETAPAGQIRMRISDLRHDLLTSVARSRRPATPFAVSSTTSSKSKRDPRSSRATSRSHSTAPTTSCCARSTAWSSHVTWSGACATTCSRRSRTTRTR